MENNDIGGFGFIAKKSSATVPSKTLVTEELKKDIVEEGGIEGGEELKPELEGEIIENTPVDAGATGDNIDVVASPKSSGI